jgi:N-glycosylase/DNA lyase
MKQLKLPIELQNKYDLFKSDIQERLNDFANVQDNKIFYELCYCICTPQSKARSASLVQQILEKDDFLNNPYDPTDLLRLPGHYIRFHNQKAKRILDTQSNFDKIYKLIKSDITPQEKRMWFADNFNGFGMKESAHFLRNIGYKNLGILDRHILKHLVNCGLYDEVPNISSQKKYLEVEEKFHNFAIQVNIPIDELDLLFWSYETGEILK